LRQTIVKQYDPGRGVLISTLSYEYPRNHSVPEHAHDSDQLIYAISGVMEVAAGESIWLIPPHFAIWVPARMLHSIKMTRPVSMRTLYMRRGLARRLVSRCVVLHVKPFLRELIVEAVRIGKLERLTRLHASLSDLLIARLENASPIPTSVTMPRDPRARALAAQVLENMTDRRSLVQMCSSVGTGVRTMQRIFRREVGSDFEFWRRQVRLMKAVELLVSGSTVKEAAFAVGYQQPTAFVSMFRSILGATPKAWVQALRVLG